MAKQIKIDLLDLIEIKYVEDANGRIAPPLVGGGVRRIEDAPARVVVEARRLAALTLAAFKEYVNTDDWDGMLAAARAAEEAQKR